ncbi:MAG: Ger(x)C family spore germination protein [Firmicutes bacterium]|nr:Ger(x)C family spore germination protein [Bacillota bacterium]
MKRALSVILLLALILFVPGCYDYSEPDDKAWILAIGFDKSKQNKLLVTTVIAVPKNIAGGSGGEPAGGGGGGAETFFTVTMEVPTMLSALELVNSAVDRRADMSHTKWLVFSRELAEEGIARHYAPLSRFYQFRRSTNVVICEGRAEDFLKQGKPILEDNVGKYYELLMGGWRYADFIPFDTFHQFYMKSEEKGITAIAPLAALNRSESMSGNDAPQTSGEYQAGRIPRKGGGSIEIMGAAVFRKGRMVGTLNGNQVGVQKLFFGTLKYTILDLPDPKHPDDYIVVDVTPRSKPRVEVLIGEDGLPRISVRVDLEGSILNIQSGEEYEKPDRLAIVERAVERALLEQINEAVFKSQEMGTDYLGLGLHAKKLFRTWSQWMAYDWDGKYPEATVTVSVDYKVRRIGLIHEMAPLQ